MALPKNILILMMTRKKTHTFKQGAGIYQIKIRGVVKGWQFNNGGDAKKFVRVYNWGCLNPFNINAAFYGCTNLLILATDLLNLADTTGLFNFFRGCSSLTSIPNVGLWDVTSVGGYNNTFRDCPNLDMSLSTWDVSGLIKANNFLNGSQLSTSNYDALLIAWEAQEVQNGVTFHGGNSTYSAGAAATARAALISDHSWSITDGGLA